MRKKDRQLTGVSKKFDLFFHRRHNDPEKSSLKTLDEPWCSLCLGGELKLSRAIRVFAAHYCKQDFCF
jgi:hypothetical protein